MLRQCFSNNGIYFTILLLNYVFVVAAKCISLKYTPTLPPRMQYLGIRVGLYYAKQLNFVIVRVEKWRE